jgi:hypothetical protein
LLKRREVDYLAGMKIARAKQENLKKGEKF